MTGDIMAGLEAKIDEYFDANWDDIVKDVEALVSIESCESLGEAAPGAPFGPGPRKALDAVLSLAERMGFETHDVDGYIGYADFPGDSDTQIGIIGHVDVVPAGPGWSMPPFEVTRKDGYLLGRGVIDDKGPTVVTLHVLKFWKDLLAEEGSSVRFPYTVRYLFGANEETGMRDVAYYRARFADPAFVITPDAQFPACYGEKGCYNATVYSAPIEDGEVIEMAGGMAPNAVPGQAHAVVRVSESLALNEADGISASVLEEGPDASLVRIDAQGKSAHASLPEGGVNAIKVLVDYLMDNGIGTPDERAFFAFEQKLLGSTDGSGVGINAEDEHFGELTVVGGVIELRRDEDGRTRFAQSVDSRYPTTISSAEITARLAEHVEAIGGTCAEAQVKQPFLMDRESPAVQALVSAYNEATGEQAEPFTMGGGTYARLFTRAASFGVEMPWVEDPAWVGAMHGPDEGVSEELLKQTFKIYALTLPKLMQIDWQAS